MSSPGDSPRPTARLTRVQLSLPPDNCGSALDAQPAAREAEPANARMAGDRRGLHNLRGRGKEEIGCGLRLHDSAGLPPDPGHPADSRETLDPLMRKARPNPCPIRSFIDELVARVRRAWLELRQATPSMTARSSTRYGVRLVYEPFKDAVASSRSR